MGIRNPNWRNFEIDNYSSPCINVTVRLFCRKWRNRCLCRNTRLRKSTDAVALFYWFLGTLPSCEPTVERQICPPFQGTRLGCTRLGCNLGYWSGKSHLRCKAASSSIYHRQVTFCCKTYLVSQLPPKCQAFLWSLHERWQGPCDTLAKTTSFLGMNVSLSLHELR